MVFREASKPVLKSLIDGNISPFSILADSIPFSIELTTCAYLGVIEYSSIFTIFRKFFIAGKTKKQFGLLSALGLNDNYRIDCRGTSAIKT